MVQVYFGYTLDSSFDYPNNYHIRAFLEGLLERHAINDNATIKNLMVNRGIKIERDWHILNISIPLELISKSDYITVHYLVNRD